MADYWYMFYFGITIVEQVPGKPFNRGKLINVGYLETKPSNFCAHDVDMVPKKVYYKPTAGIVQLAGSNIQKTDYLGGVTMFNSIWFERLGGYHNEFWHRAEDNEMMFNIKRLGMYVENHHGEFKMLPHPRTGPEFIPELWEKAQKPREVQDQLSICEYKVISRNDDRGYTHLLVDI